MDKGTHNTRASFQALPVELHWKVFEYLDYASALFLGATCRVIQARAPMQFQSTTNKNDFLFVAENYAQHLVARRYACFYCNTIEPRIKFAKDMVRGPYNKKRPYTRSRFCLDCGTREGFYDAGEKVRRTDGVVLWKCSVCPALTDGFYCVPCEKCHACLVAEFGPRSERCPAPTCMARDAERLRRMQECQMIFEEALPYSSILEATDEVFQPLPQPEQPSRRTTENCLCPAYELDRREYCRQCEEDW